MKALFALFFFFSSTAFADTQVITVSSRFFGSRIEVVTANAAVYLGERAIAACPNGVHRLRNMTFQYVDGDSRVVKNENSQTEIITATLTVIATALADCK